MAQAGKDGYVYVLNRETGESLFPIEERPIPASDVAGELLAKTQRIPLKPKPFSRQEFTEDIVTQRTPEARRAVLDQLRNLDFGGRFTPPSLKGTVIFPGFSGGAEWGGGAYDPETHIYYVNANEMAWILRLVTPEQLHDAARASRIYQSRCGSCHRPDRKGPPPEYPALDDLSGKRGEAQIADVIREGGAPNVVPERLKVPLALAGRRVEAENRGKTWGTCQIWVALCASRAPHPQKQETLLS